MHFRPFLLGLCLFLSVLSARAQADYQPTAENLQAREWFQDAKYGMFIHWGVYSVVGGGGDRGVAEWLMQQKQISVDDYEQLPHYFNPTAFDAKAWVQLAKDAGMHYITITSKHHDGFAMYDSQVSDYDIVDRTPYGKDVLKLLKDECDRQGIKLFFYHSQLDWHHPGYYPRGRTGQYTGRPDEGNWQHYLDYQNAQLTELLTHYGDVAGIWFDGWWDKAEAPAWKLDETYALIHKLQPQALIGNNHHRAPFPGEDFQMFEKDLPGHNTTGFGSSANDIGTLPRETCETMNGSWGYNLTDDRYKSTKDLVHYLVRAAGYNANFLLNVGPQPNGEIQSEFQDTLRAVGTWLQTYGPTVYGTRGGPVAPKTWGVTTQKDNKVYVHVLDYADRTLLIPDFKGRVKSARLFNSGSKVKYQTNAYGLLLELPQNRTGDLDTVIELTL